MSCACSINSSVTYSRAEGVVSMSKLEMPPNVKQRVRDVISRGSPSLSWYEDIGMAAMDALYEFPDRIGLDHRDHIRYAMKIGLLVTSIMDNTSVPYSKKSAVFIELFENTILNDEE